MGIAERKEREKEQRKNDIIDAAERMFFSKGIAATTMDDIAEEAELSKGTIYLYFKSKEDLYLAIHYRGLHILKTMFEETVQQCKTGLEKVYSIGMAYYRFYKEHTDYFNALLYYESRELNLNDIDSMAFQCDHKGVDALNVLIEAIKIGINDGSIRPDIDPAKTAAILWGQTSGLIQLVHLRGDHLHSCHKICKEELLHYSFELIRYSLENR